MYYGPTSGGILPRAICTTALQVAGYYPELYVLRPYKWRDITQSYMYYGPTRGGILPRAIYVLRPYRWRDITQSNICTTALQMEGYYPELYVLRPNKWRDITQSYMYYGPTSEGILPRAICTTAQQGEGYYPDRALIIFSNTSDRLIKLSYYVKLHKC